MTHARRFVLVAAVVFFTQFPAAAAQKETPQIPTPCSASVQACDAWRMFRKKHPFPYQTIAVRMPIAGEKAVIVISEPPPITSPAQIAEIASAVFADYSAQVHRLRFPIGLDGWLEDVVLEFHSTTDIERIAIPTASGGTVALPAGLANRIEYLHGVLFGLTDTFYVDTINDVTGPRKATLPDVAMTATDILGFTGDKHRIWRKAETPDLPGITLTEVIESTTQAGSYIDDSSLVVALFIPQNTDITKIRTEFRRFAVAGDYLVGAFRPKGGGLVLLARERIIPLDILPPLRFETVATLAASIGRPLGQSYERQRAFAGKIEKGEHAGWDWAPIYLSPELEDSELGTLLNIADQQLKSWSERGEIRYATFDYPDPLTFPFGEMTAAGWFSDQTLMPSLIFNWNTTAFSTVVPHRTGRIISAASSTALPVSYIVPEDLGVDRLRRQLNELGFEFDDGAVAIAGSNRGTEYFASLGDPILARVVQNVFLYQILSETKPFKKTAQSASNSLTRRSRAVTAILTDEATRWLTLLLKDRYADADLLALVRSSGLDTTGLARLLASPDGNTKAITRARETIDLQQIRLKRLVEAKIAKATEHDTLAEKSNTEFIAYCKELRGTIEETPKGMTCRYEATREAHFEGSYDDRIAALGKELETITTDITTTVAARESAVKALQKYASESKLAAQLSEALSVSPTFGEDLQRILDRVLEATGSAPSTSAIQTASVVLSMNTENASVVGGHNIDALPWLVKTSPKKGKPIIVPGERPTIVLGSDQIGSSTQVARSEVQHGVVPLDSAPRTLTTALRAEGKPSGTFLERLRRNPPRAADVGILERAKLCQCDVYIERGAAETSTVVTLKPPPPTPKTVFGSSHLIDQIDNLRSTRKLLFAGFEHEQVASLTRNAARKAGTPTASTIKGIFGRAADLATETLRFRTAGQEVRIGAKRIALADALSQRPPWNEATIKDVVDLDGRISLVEVTFPEKPGDVTSLTAFAYDGAGTPVTKRQLREAASQVLRSSASDESLKETIEKLATRLYQDNSVKDVEVFLNGLDSNRIVRLPRPTPENIATAE